MAKAAPKKKVLSVNKVRVFSPYNGMPSGMKLIPAGIYDENDPALLGIGQYLVETRHADLITSSIEVDDAEGDVKTEEKIGDAS